MEKTLQDTMPDEILVKIFSFVHPFDLKSLRQVCSRFRRLSWDPEVTKSQCLQLRDEPITEDEFDYPHLQIRAGFRYGHRLFNRSNFFQIRGENVHTLHIQSVSLEFLNRIMKYVPSLQCLFLDCGPPGCHNLDKDLSLMANNIRHVEIKFCGLDASYLESMKNLNLVNLENFHFGIGNALGVTEFMDSPFFLTILENSKSSLKRLCLATPINDITFLKRCLRKIGPQLQTLELSETSLSTELINVVSAQFPNLVSFDFNYSDESLLLQQHLHSKLPRLIGSRFLDSYKANSVSFINNVFENFLLKFKWKDISSITKLVIRLDVPNEVLKKVLKLLLNLRILTVKLSHQMDTETLNVIGENCAGLRSLDIEGNGSIREVHSLNLIKGLLSLTLTYFYNLDDSEFSVLHFSELRKLKIDNCWKITKVGVRNIISNCVALRYIEVPVNYRDKEREYHTARSLHLVKIQFIYNDDYYDDPSHSHDDYD